MSLSIIQGTHDFACFETAGSRDLRLTNGKGSIRTITEAVLLNPNPFFYEISITGDGFLRHMVRNIVGTILEVGLQKRSVENLRETLLSKHRSKAGTTAPAHGLSLIKIGNVSCRVGGCREWARLKILSVTFGNVLPPFTSPNFLLFFQAVSFLEIAINYLFSHSSFSIA